MSSLVVPRGGLVSWGTFTFNTKRSKPLTGWVMSSQAVHRVQAGSLFTVDGGAHGVLPMDYVLPYEYLITCNPGGSVADVQTELNALTALIGLSQTQTLTIHLLGSTGVAAGAARIERLTDVEGQPTRVRLHIEFYIEGGLWM